MFGPSFARFDHGSRGLTMVLPAASESAIARHTLFETKRPACSEHHDPVENRDPEERDQADRWLLYPNAPSGKFYLCKSLLTSPAPSMLLRMRVTRFCYGNSTTTAKTDSPRPRTKNESIFATISPTHMPRS